MPSEPLVVGFGAGIRQDLHRSALPPGALYRAQNVRRRSGAALGPRTDMPTAGLTARSTAFALAGAAHAIGERSGNQVVAAGLSVWERSTSEDPWNEVGRVSRFQPLRADLIGPVDSLSREGAGPLAHQWAAAIGNLVAVGYATSTSAVFEIRTESGRLLNRFIEPAASASSAQVFPKVLAMPLSGTSGKFVCIWYKTGVGVQSASYDIASDTLGPVSTLGAAIFNTADGFDASPLSSSTWVLAYKSAATTMTVKRLDGDSNVLAPGPLLVTITAGALQGNCISASGTAGEGVWVLYVIAGVGTRGFTTNDTITAVITADTLVLAEGGGDTFTRPAVCRVSNPTRFYMQHSSTSTVTATFDKIQTFALGLNLGIASLQTFCGCALSSLPECPDGAEARFWVDFLPVRADGQRSALISTSVVLGVNAPRVIELTTDRRAGGSAHKPPIAHGTMADWYASNVVLRTDSTLGNTVAPQLVGYVPYSSSAAAASRQVIEAAGVLNVCGGGVITECWGENGRVGNSFAFRLGIDNGLPTPNLFGASISAGGALGSGVYQYCVVFTYIDAVGRECRSAPSNIVVATTTVGNNTVTLHFSMVEVGDRPFWQSGSLTAHVYRTQLGGDTFYRITSNVAAPSAAFGFSGSQDYTDTASDASIIDNEIIYVDGGVLANQPAPAHRFAVFGDGRLWTAGTWEPTGVECSRVTVGGEPLEFTRNEAFRTYLPEPVTALSYMDGSCVAFSARAVYVIAGSGPSDEGANPLPAPARVPGGVGCIEPRSVLEVPEGILFQSDRGLYLLPRGFGTPQLVSAGVQDDFAGQTVLGAARVHYDAFEVLADGNASMGSRLVALLLGATTLILDEDKLDWVSVDSYGPTYGVAGTWGGRLVLASATLNNADPTTLLLESTAFAAGLTATIETGDIAPFGLFGIGRVRGAQVLSELWGDTRITATVVYDGRYPPDSLETHQLDVTLPTGSAGIRERTLIKTTRQHCTSVRLELSLTTPSGAAGPTALLLSVGLEVEPESGPARVAPVRVIP